MEEIAEKVRRGRAVAGATYSIVAHTTLVPGCARIADGLMGDTPMDLLGDIRDDLLDQSSDLTDTLRKTIMLAQEHQSSVLREWVESELNGYPELATVPEYRRVRITLAGTFKGPAGRSIPGVGISAAGLHWRVRDSINNLYIHDSVAALEDSLAHDVHHRNLPVQVVAWLREANQMEEDMELVEAYQQISRYSIVGILQSIRNRLLDFVLEMQKLEAASNDENGDGAETEAARDAINIIIRGDNNSVVAAGGNIWQEIAPVQQGDLDSLVAHLQGHQVPDEDIQELRNAVNSEPTTTDGGFGPNVRAWLGGMVSKAVSGAWQVASEEATTTLVNAISAYYNV